MLGPFFSAIHERNVVYRPVPPQGNISKLFSFFSNLVNQNPILKGSTYLVCVAGNISAASHSPWSAALPLLFTAYLGYQHVILTQAFKRKAAFLNTTAHIPPPSIQSHPTQKNRHTTTFNHVFSFVKANGLWWYALRDNQKKPPEWKRFYVDNLPLEDIENSEIIADGANVMIGVKRKTHREIFYKKVIAEERRDEKYFITNLCEDPLAINAWFTLPGVRILKPSQLNERLNLPLDIDWTMSHSGDYKGILREEIRDTEHCNKHVTTVFELNPLTSIIRLHDPYVEENSVYEIKIPENIMPYSKIEASASCLFFIGQERGDSQGEYSLFWRYLDYDSQGFHPILSYTHDVYDIHRRLLPFPSWQKQSLPKDVGPHFIISALQCGNNHHTVEIRLHHPESTTAFFYKRLKDTWWQSSEDGIVCSSELQKVTLSFPAFANAYTSSQHFKLKGKEIIQTICYSFDPLTDFCPVVLTQKAGSDIHLQLYRYKNMITAFLGPTSESWSFRPDPNFADKTSILSKNEYLSVNITYQEPYLTIDSLDKAHPFHLDLTKQPTFTPLFEETAHPQPHNPSLNDESHCSLSLCQY